MKKVFVAYRFWVTLIIILTAVILTGFLTLFTNTDELSDMFENY